jgi:hypothetical protein
MLHLQGDTRNVYPIIIAWFHGLTEWLSGLLHRNPAGGQQARDAIVQTFIYEFPLLKGCTAFSNFLNRCSSVFILLKVEFSFFFGKVYNSDETTPLFKTALTLIESTLAALLDDSLTDVFLVR